MALFINSYVYTLPQQNSVAEHKNHHLLETTCTFLIHRKVPKYFWSDAVLISCYLINRVPSFVFQNQIPYSALCPQSDLFSRHQRFLLVCVLFRTVILIKLN